MLTLDLNDFVADCQSLPAERVVVASILRHGVDAFNIVNWKLDADDLSGDPVAHMIFEIVENLPVEEPIRAGVERVLHERGITLDLDELVRWSLPSSIALPRLCATITERARKRREQFLQKFASLALRAEAQHRLWSGKAA